jgi:uncharacterized protein (TIGR03089 family)
VETSGAAFDSFNVAAERQTGRYGDKPFCTWYDDQAGERVELSYKTFENWVAKTANLLVDELGAEPGDRVGAALVNHWQTAIIVAACWRAGMSVVALDPSGGQQAPPRTPPPAEPLVAAFVWEELLAAVAAAADGVPLVAVTADRLGRTDRNLGRALAYAKVVPGMGDLFPAGPDPAGVALDAGGEAATMADLLARAAALAERTGLGDTDRLLSGRPLLSVEGAAAGLVAPFLCGAGVVLARDLDPARFWKRVADERVAVAVLTPGQAAAVRAAGEPPAGPDRSRLRVVLDA